MSDEDLIRRLKERKEDGLSDLVDTYGNLIYRASYKILEDVNLSEESLNTTLYRVWDNIESFTGDNDKFKNWIFTIAKYTAIDILDREESHDGVKNIADNKSLVKEV